jgi:hypothetical protein
MSDDLAAFNTLDFYPINEKFFVTILLELKKRKLLGTSTERTPSYVKYGEVHFTIDGQALKLNVYRNIELSKERI